MFQKIMYIALVELDEPGATGQAIAFCSPDEAEYLLDIEKTIALQIPDVREHPWHCYPALEKVLVKREERAETNRRRKT